MRKTHEISSSIHQQRCCDSSPQRQWTRLWASHGSSMTSLAVRPACYLVGLMLKAGGERQSCDSSSQFPHCGAPSVASAFFSPSLTHTNDNSIVESDWEMARAVPLCDFCIQGMGGIGCRGSTVWFPVISARIEPCKPLEFLPEFGVIAYHTWTYSCSVWMYQYKWECSYNIQVLLEEQFISTNYNLRMGSSFLFFSLNLHQVFFPL